MTQKYIKPLKYYSPLEEKINVISHAIGLILSCIAFVFLLTKAISFDDFLITLSFSVYGISLILLYAASTFYHNSKSTKLRTHLKILDHAAIYILIAGSYTPFTLITLNGSLGWLLFCTTWTFAITGIFLKLFYTGRFNIISTLMYVLMGWIIVFAINPLINNLSTQGLNWLFIGGISYTVGAIIYSIKRIKFNHAIFHVFVLFGSISHFISIYLFVL